MNYILVSKIDGERIWRNDFTGINIRYRVWITVLTEKMEIKGTNWTDIIQRRKKKLANVEKFYMGTKKE